jgi:hypothetical protein
MVPTGKLTIITNEDTKTTLDKKFSRKHNHSIAAKLWKTGLQ